MEQFIKIKNLSIEIVERIYASYYNIGNIFQKLHYETEAYHCYGKCIYTINAPISIQQKALYHYGIMYKNHAQNLTEMIEIIENNLEKNGKNMMLAILVSQYLFDMNKYEKAQNILVPYRQELIDNQMIEAFIPSIPIVYNSQKEIDVFRKILEESIDKLINTNIAIPEINLSLTNMFYLAFHNRNNKSLLSKLSSLYEKVTPSLAYTSQHCKNYQFKSKKIKLGIVSNFLVLGHPVFKMIENIINFFIRNSKYELYIFSFSEKTKKIFSQNTYLLNPSVKDSRKIISKYKLDVIIYPEIGMHPNTYMLGHSRLAPVQCVMPGHPVTTGIKNIDYFLSNKYVESKENQDQYTENLILFDSFPSKYNKPIPPNYYTSKKVLGLEDNKHNYLIPAKLQKIHPDYDLILSKLIQKDAKANLIFFKDHSDNQWDSFIQERLSKNLSKEHLTFLPWANKQTFYSLLYHSDVVLEPTVFGYGTTAIEAFSIGTPIVTLPLKYHYGKVTSSYYKKMGIEDLITSNEEEYIKKSIHLATNKRYKDLCREKILKYNFLFYDKNNIEQELVNFIDQKLTK